MLVVQLQGYLFYWECGAVEPDCKLFWRRGVVVVGARVVVDLDLDEAEEYFWGWQGKEEVSDLTTAQLWWVARSPGEM